jgi:hypothetical protein
MVWDHHNASFQGGMKLFTKVLYGMYNTYHAIFHIILSTSCFISLLGQHFD